MEKLLGYGWGIAVRGLRLVIKANNTVKLAGHQLKMQQGLKHSTPLARF